MDTVHGRVLVSVVLICFMVQVAGNTVRKIQVMKVTTRSLKIILYHLWENVSR